MGEARTTKETIHQLVEQLPDSELPAVRRFLEFLRDVGGDPVLGAAKTAPTDDEPDTEKERAATLAALERVRRGEAIPDAELDAWLARERADQRTRAGYEA